MIAAQPFAGKNLAVFGLGRSGLAAARSLSAGNAHVRAWDDDPARRDVAASQGVPLDDLYAADWRGIEGLVLSPGIPLTAPEPHEIVLLARSAGCAVFGDIEVFARTLPGARVAAVTGTNGKSTTTSLAAFVLRACGHEAIEGGNLGRAALDLPVLGGDGVYVLELSSYQIALTHSLAAEVAVLLNLSADHLDRHGDMAGYVSIKKRLFGCQRPEQLAVVGVDDEHARGLFDELIARARRVVPVSASGPIERGIYVDAGVLHDARFGTAEPVADLRRGHLIGAHNWQNAAAAFAVATAFGCDSVDAARALLAYPGLAHRLEPIATVRGVRFVNDSKATNAQAAARALACFPDVYWIAGGRPKSGSYDELRQWFPHVRRAFLIGEAEPALAALLGTAVPHSRSGTLAQAVEDAFALARTEGRQAPVVLLSPACASFDQFRDYEHRGETFRALVAALAAPAEQRS